MPEKSSNTVRVAFPPFTREELIRRLRNDVAGLAAVLPLSRVALFGSWAAGRATVASDVDLLVVYEGSPHEGAYGMVRQAMGLRQLEPHVYTVDEAQQVGDVLRRMTRGAVELWPD